MGKTLRKVSRGAHPQGIGKCQVPATKTSKGVVRSAVVLHNVSVVTNKRGAIRYLCSGTFPPERSKNRGATMM